MIGLRESTDPVPLGGSTKASSASNLVITASFSVHIARLKEIYKTVLQSILMGELPQ